MSLTFSSQVNDDFFASIRRWICTDPDPETKQELQLLLDKATENSPQSYAAMAELKSRFSSPVKFGTSGLRARLGAGTNHMNRLVVRQSAQGLANFCLESFKRKNIAEKPVAVIGYDARHNSYNFGHDTAVIFSAAGITTLIMPYPVPTPLTAFACRYYNSDIAVMVTASHNPPQDNGYKVYFGGRLTNDDSRGSQIVSPTDKAIAKSISEVDPLTLGDDSKIFARKNTSEKTPWTTLNKDIIDQYFKLLKTNLASTALTSLNTPETDQPRRQPHILITGLHGVGSPFLHRALNEAGHNNVSLVVEQADPAPNFPTVKYPNPEDRSALELAYKYAALSQNGINPVDIIIAVDPDADRCSISVPTRKAKNKKTLRSKPSGWTRLSGDEAGIILAHYLIETKLDSSKPDQVLANTVVSSPLLEKIASKHGLKYIQTGNGFKWISRVPHLFFGYEQALGYSVLPQEIHDKDGISAAVVLANMGTFLLKNHTSIWDYLDKISLTYGFHHTSTISLKLSQDSSASEVLEYLANNLPEKLDNQSITRISPMNSKQDLRSQSSDGLIVELENNDNIMVRPSGTEPKIKFYFDSSSNPTTAEELKKARSEAKNKTKNTFKEILNALGTRL